MAEPLVVNLLGPPRLSQAEVPVTCASRKALGLFAYLALSPRAHARRELAALFWGRGDEETARASLRVALHRLPAAMAQCLRVDRDSIAVAAPPLVDVAAFESLARAEDLDSLERATALYQGELLQDFEPDATPEFDDWLHAQRTRLAQLAQQAFDGAIAQRSERARHDVAHATSERESALATGRRWAALMPGAEAAHRWLVQLYLDMGQRDAAIAQYDVCQRFLAVTYGRAPSAQMRELYEVALGREATPEAREADARAVVPATSFVGRIEELAELDRLLSDPNCRLLTLHGLGGAGKTRLAHALAGQVATRFARGVTWVGLEAAESADALPLAIATALGRDLPAQGDRADAVAAMLAGQERLLVLDNMETLQAAASAASDAEPANVLGRILERAPKVRVLVTSREVLGLQEEWVYDVHGLAYEPQAALAGATPAVELFAQRARQAYLGFSLPAEVPHVLRICALVEGLPLGLELAAAWVRTIPCGEIAAAIERTGASLESRHRNRADRHRSLNAVVAYSWDLLTTEQRSTLAALSVFAGGFTRESAERVANASLRSLSALVDKSLVRRRPEGRYSLHEIVRQFALARLETKKARHTAAMRAHAELFVQLVLDIVADTSGPNEAGADAKLATELANIIAAFDRAVQAPWRELVTRATAPLAMLLFTRGRVRTALDVARRGIELLGDTAHDDVLAAIRSQYGRAAMIMGQMDVGRRELEAGVAAARRSGNVERLGRSLHLLSAFVYQTGDMQAAETILRELVPLADRTGNHELIALARNAAGAEANMHSEFAQAEAHLVRALAAAREYGRPSLIAGTLCGMGPALYYQGKFDEAAAVHEEAAEIFARLGRNTILPNLRSNIAAILIAKGDFDGALPSARSAVELSREMGEFATLGASLCTLADLELRLSRLDDARDHAREGLDAATATQSYVHMQEALFLLASIEVAGGRRDEALAYLRGLRDALARQRLEVRVPMLILASADWIGAFDHDRWPKARAWLAGIVRDEAVDATLRDRAKAILTRAGEAAGDAPAMRSIEAEVLAWLA